MQIIFVVEADKNSKSDWVYIRETYDRFYKEKKGIKLSPVYMAGKGNFRSKRVTDTIKKLTKDYSRMNDDGTKVIYCFDTDRYDTDKSDRLLLSQAREFCIECGYLFVWFCRDIESVYLGRKVERNQKVKEASKFRSSHTIETIDERRLSQNETFSENASNILTVLRSL